MLAHPDHAPVLVDHPVLGIELGESRARLRVRGGAPVAVVGVQHLEPELVLGQPRRVLVAQEVLDLGTDVERQRLARVVGLDAVQVDDDPGDVFEQALEALRGLASTGVQRHLRRYRQPCEAA